MTDEQDPFADLDDSIGGETSPEDVTTEKPTQATETTVETDATDRPAFPFDDAKQDSLYARKEAWREFEDTLDFEVKRILRDRGYENIEGRELHDAALRVLADHAEEIADQFGANRKKK